MSENDTFFDFEKFECYRSVQFDSIFVIQLAFIPVGLIILTLAFLQRRRNLYRKCLDGRPGVPLPLHLFHNSNRFVYVAGFSVTAWLLVDMIWNDANIFHIHTTRFAAGPIKFLSCLAVGVLCYPIFGGVTSEHWLGYLMGTVYTLGFSVFYILTNYPCENAKRIGISGDAAMGHTLDWLKFLPCLLWLLFLCVYYPFRSIMHFAEARGYFYRTGKKPNEDVPYYVRHVRQVFSTYNSSEKPKVLLQGNMIVRIYSYLFAMVRNVYTPLPDFQYSVSILTAVSVSILLIYLFAIAFISSYYDMVASLKVLVLLLKENIQNQTGIDPDELIKDAEVIKEIEFWVNDVIALVLFGSLTMGFLLTALSVLSTLKQHRRNLLTSYKGGFPYQESLPKSPCSLVVNSTRYIGYQFGYSFWGFAIHSVCFLIMAFIVTVILVVVFRYKYYSILLSILETFGPSIAYIFILMYLQQALVHFFFLSRAGTKRKLLVINNRSWFTNYQYFMVFVNSVLGLVSCFIRIMKAMVYGLWSLPRLDRSTLSRDYEAQDAGFAAYACFLKMESIRTNPAMLTFLFYAYQETQTAKVAKLAASNRWHTPHFGTSDYFINSLSSDVSLGEHKKRKVARNRWWLYITLTNNPGLIQKRKFYCADSSTALSTVLSRCITNTQLGKEEDLIENPL